MSISEMFQNKHYEQKHLALLITSKEAGLEVNTEKIKYTGMYQIYIHEDINSILTSGNACYHSVQNIFSSYLLSTNTNIKIHRNIILPVLSFRCDACFLTIRKEHRLSVFENRVLRKIFGTNTVESNRKLGNHLPPSNIHS
jgi:hypothetical protein